MSAKCLACRTPISFPAGVDGLSNPGKLILNVLILYGVSDTEQTEGQSGKGLASEGTFSFLVAPAVYLDLDRLIEWECFGHILFDSKRGLL